MEKITKTKAARHVVAGVFGSVEPGPNISDHEEAARAFFARTGARFVARYLGDFEKRSRLSSNINSIINISTGGKKMEKIKTTTAAGAPVRVLKNEKRARAAVAWYAAYAEKIEQDRDRALWRRYAREARVTATGLDYCYSDL